MIQDHLMRYVITSFLLPCVEWKLNAILGRFINQSINKYISLSYAYCTQFINKALSDKFAEIVNYYKAL